MLAESITDCLTGFNPLLLALLLRLSLSERGTVLLIVMIWSYEGVLSTLERSCGVWSGGLTADLLLATTTYWMLFIGMVIGVGGCSGVEGLSKWVDSLFLIPWWGRLFDWMCVAGWVHHSSHQVAFKRSLRPRSLIIIPLHLINLRFLALLSVTTLWDDLHLVFLILL